MKCSKYFLLKAARNDERVARKIMTFSARASQLEKKGAKYIILVEDIPLR